VPARKTSTSSKSNPTTDGLKGCSGWPKTNPSNRDVQTFRLASADLLGFASRLRNESGHNLWL
jgi:hypothetical protein